MSSELAIKFQNDINQAKEELKGVTFGEGLDSGSSGQNLSQLKVLSKEIEMINKLIYDREIRKLKQLENKL